MNNHFTISERNFISRRVSFQSGQDTSALIVTADSGRIIYRRKIDTVIGVNHPGILLGVDIWGNTWVVHNHYKYGYAVVENIADFCAGQDWWFDNRPLPYDKYTIVNHALCQWQTKKPYHWLTNNCEHFVNRIVGHSHKSNTVDKISDWAIFWGGLAAIIGLIAGKKVLFQLGAGIATTGFLGKGVSRLK